MTDLEYQAVLQRNEELEALYRVARLTMAEADLESLLSILAQELCQIFRATRCGIALFSDDRHRLMMWADTGATGRDSEADDDFLPRMVTVTDFVGLERMLAQGQAGVKGNFSLFEATPGDFGLGIGDFGLKDNDIQNPKSKIQNGDEPIQNPLQDKPKSKIQNPKSLLVVPLVVQPTAFIPDKTLGLFELQRTGAPFRATEIHLAETMAEQIAGALANAHLLEQTRALLAERRLTEAKLRASGEALRTVFNGVYVAIFMLDLDGRVMDVNQRGLDMFGVSPSEAHMLCWPTDFCPIEGFEVFWQQAITGKALLFEWPVRRHEKGGLFEAELFLQRVVIEGDSFVLANVRDISERKAAERAVQLAYRRSQTLYLISNALAEGEEREATVEAVLGHYVRLLGWDWGGVVLFEGAGIYRQEFWANVTPTPDPSTSEGEGRPEPSTFEGAGRPEPSTSEGEGRVTPGLLDSLEAGAFRQAFTLSGTSEGTNSLTNLLGQEFGDRIGTVIFLPLRRGEQLLSSGVQTGLLAVGAVATGRVMSEAEVELGEALADQLSLWLERRQLLKEARYRSDRLQTVAEVSRVANSILQIEVLIETSVNLIRNRFNFYYVGLFLVDEAAEWAVLAAGTGEAGERMLARHHRLKVGIGMIGWSVANRQARIALDVGEDAVRFVNPDLPDTRSEMALPLISQEEVLGALTVQSVAERAFSNEDITLLQTMADQLANAIKNARLFQRVAQAQQESEERLQETIALQGFSQSLAATLDLREILDIFLQAVRVQVGFDFGRVWLVDELRIINYQLPITEESPVIGNSQFVIESVIGNSQFVIDKSLIAEVMRTGKTEFLFADEYPPTGTSVGRLGYKDGERGAVGVLTPLRLRQKTIGLVEAGYHLAGTSACTPEGIGRLPFEVQAELHGEQVPSQAVSAAQVRQLQALAAQTTLGIDNARRYEASQRAARRESLIKEITTKVRASTNVETILQTAIKEVGQAIGSSLAYIQLIKPDESRNYELEITN